jgi:hypothetical protein
MLSAFFKGSSGTVWLILPALVALAFFISTWEIRKVHLPRKRRLQHLRKNILSKI